LVQSAAYNYARRLPCNHHLRLRPRAWLLQPQFPSTTGATFFGRYAALTQSIRRPAARRESPLSIAENAPPGLNLRSRRAVRPEPSRPFLPWILGVPVRTKNSSRGFLLSLLPFAVALIARGPPPFNVFPIAKKFRVKTI